MARGVVCMVNRQRGMVAVNVGDGDFTVVEIIDTEGLELNESVRGDLNSLGGGSLIRERDGRRISVYIQSVQATLSSARALTLGR